MIRAATLFVVLVFASCMQKDMTLEDLKEAKWDSLARGVYYISKADQKGVAVKADSLELKLKGVAGKQINLFELSLAELPELAKESLNNILKENLPDSKSGFLKINFSDMLRPEQVAGTIYLREDYSHRNDYTLDSASLMGVDEITSFSFMSKEEAKKKYLGDGNSDWDDVLDANPLPNSFEIVLAKKDWTEESLNELKNKLHEKLVMVSDIKFPMVWVKQSDDYFFFEYKRK